jgi:hypothetical protein
VSSAPETGSAEEGERVGRREQQALGCCVSARAGALNGRSADQSEEVRETAALCGDRQEQSSEEVKRATDTR